MRVRYGARRPSQAKAGVSGVLLASFVSRHRPIDSGYIIMGVTTICR